MRRPRLAGRSSAAEEEETLDVAASASELEVAPVVRCLKRELPWFIGFRSVFCTKLAPVGMCTVSGPQGQQNHQWNFPQRLHSKLGFRLVS